MREKLTYLCTDNISLEATVHWLPKIQSSLRSMLGFTRNMQKCNSNFDSFWLHTQQTVAAALYASVIMATIASLPGVRLFCMVWAILASLREHLMCRCLHVVRLLVTTFRYGIRFRRI